MHAEVLLRAIPGAVVQWQVEMRYKASAHFLWARAFQELMLGMSKARHIQYA